MRTATVSREQQRNDAALALSGAKFSAECPFSVVSSGDREAWVVGERIEEGQYGERKVADGIGRVEVIIHEVLISRTSGPICIFEKVFTSPDGERLSAPRRLLRTVRGLKGYLRLRKLERVQP
jgi:hypothetical protein